MYAAHTSCRACGSADLQQYLDLGVQAPANALRQPNDLRTEFTAPLTVAWCSECGLSQLEQVVSPEVLYTDYPFRSGISQRWTDHVKDLVDSFHPGKRLFLVDIGSNDGALLTEAQSRGWKVLGVDPEPYGDAPSIQGYWSERIARAICQFHGQADIVTATNVFGHVDDAKGFLSAIAMVLQPTGQAIIECPHIIPLLDNTAFDTIYHEHLSYWSLKPLELLAESVGLKVMDVQSFRDLHGGTMRYTLRPDDGKPSGRSVNRLRVLENGLFKEGLTAYTQFAQRVDTNLQRFREMVSGLRADWQRIWGYGANAKGAVLLQASGISTGTIEVIVDDTEAKWGMRMPGSGVPITRADSLSEPDVLILLSWNNATELKAKAFQHGFQGRFLIPIPEPRLE